MIEPGLWDMIMRLRSRGISDTRVIEAFERAPRSRFVPDALRARAYDDAVLPLPCGQEMLRALLAAQMLQLASPKPDDKILVVGAGSGQVVGLAACMSRRVYAIERYRQLLALGDANLARAGVAGVVSRWGDGRYGWKANAPFDVILVTAGLSKLSDVLPSQLEPGGRLVAVVDGHLSRVSGGTTETLFPVAVPPIEAGKSAAL